MNTQEIQLTVGRTADLVDAEPRQTILERCRGLLYNSIMSNLGVPEVLEADDARLSNHAQLQLFGA